MQLSFTVLISSRVVMGKRSGGMGEVTVVGEPEDY